MARIIRKARGRRSDPGRRRYRRGRHVARHHGTIGRNLVARLAADPGFDRQASTTTSTSVTLTTVIDG